MQTLARKSSVITFRVPEPTLGTLRAEAAESKISLNTLVNQIFEKHTEWDTFARRYGHIIIRGENYRELLESIDEKSLKEAGLRAGRSLRNFLIFRYKRADLASFMTYLTTFDRYLNLGRVEVSTKESHHLIIVHHDFGRKHSVYRLAMLSAAVEDLTGLQVSAEMTDDTFVMSFETNSS